MKLLHLDASSLGSYSVSREVTAAIVENLRKQDPSIEVTYRDLAAEPLPHWAPHADASSDAAARDEAVLQEFLAADVLVMGAPMYNFAISSQLKAWIDRVLVAGKTFKYGDTGPVGLCGGKRIIIASARGGVYSEGPAAVMDFQEPYLRTAFHFIGIDAVEFIRAEGVAMGDEAKQAALKSAHVAAATITLKAA